MTNLNRRDFLKTSLAATAATAAAAMPALARGADAPASGGLYIELRAYRLRAGAGHALLDTYLEKAFIPALNARGIEAVGAFTEPDAKDGAAVWVLIPHPSLESVGSIDAAINTDPAVVAAGAAYLDSP